MKLFLFVFAAVAYLARPADTTALILPVETYLNFTELVGREGGEYTVERHIARTSDGYLLTVHRLRRADVEPRNAAPLLLMHGIFCSAEDFVRMGRNRSLAYLLANEGFDVWLGNFRGTQYSHHINMDRINPNFWIYSFHEHGVYDLPAIFDTVQNVTGAARLHYVGYSMGTTSYFVMASERPDVAARVASFTALAPVASFNPRLKDLMHFLGNLGLENTFRAMGFDPMLYHPALEKMLRLFYCSSETIKRDLCFTGFSLVFREDSAQMDQTMHSLIIARLQPASFRLMGHYLQLGGTDVFSAYDYGKTENMKKYGQREPPRYNLTANTAPTAVFYGKSDQLSSPEVASKIINTLKKTSSVVYSKPIPYDMFNHVDFIWAKDVDKLLNKNVVKMVKKFADKYN